MKPPVEENTKVLNLDILKNKENMKILLKEREVEVAPSEFREFRDYKSQSTPDDIIGDLLNEFADELNVDKEETSSPGTNPFLKFTPAPKATEREDLQNLVKNISTQLEDMKKQHKRIRFLVNEIEGQLPSD